MSNTFSTELQSQIQVNPLQIKKRGIPASEVSCFQYKGTLVDFLEFTRQGMAEQSSAGKDYRRYIAQRAERGGEWTGLGNQSAENAIETGRIDSAIEAFKLAESEIHVSPVRGNFKLSPVGNAFDIGRFMRGEPVCAYHRPKTKLPTLNINLALAASAAIEANDIARSLVKISRAAWKYQIAGGIVNITCHYSALFSRANKGVKGCVVSLKCPLANMGMFAGSLSVQFFRAMFIPFAKTLSGDYDDSLPLGHYQAPGVLNLSGKPADDALILAKLHIPRGAS